jgi:hypothetical protein
MTMSRKIGLFVIICQILLCSCGNEEPDPLVVSLDNNTGDQPVIANLGDLPVHPSENDDNYFHGDWQLLKHFGQM